MNDSIEFVRPSSRIILSCVVDTLIEFNLVSIAKTMRPMKARKYGVECWTKRESHKLHAEFWYAHVWMVSDILFFSSSFLRDCVDLLVRMCGRPTTYTVTGIGLHFSVRPICSYVLCNYLSTRPAYAEPLCVGVWNSLRGKEVSPATSFMHVRWSARLIRHWHITRYPCANWTSHNYYCDFNWMYFASQRSCLLLPWVHCPSQ